MVASQLQTPDLAVAKGIDSLTTKGLTIEMLSNISENDVPRLAVMLTLGQDPDFDAHFLTQLGYNELALMCSVTMKRGGIRSEQLKEILVSPPVIADSNTGMIDRFRNRLRGR